MAKLIVRRLLWMLLVLFVISLITFGLMHAVPGGPFTQEKPLPEEIEKLLNAKYRLDDPLPLQYLRYMGDAAIPVVTQGEQSTYLDHLYLINVALPFGDRATLRWMNFGPSYRNYNRTVSDIFRDHLPVSMQLGAVAVVISLLIGLSMGIVAALRRNTWSDYASMAVAVLGISLPAIILAPTLQYLFGVQLKWLPVSGWGSAKQFILPAFAIGIANAAVIARLTRASMLQVLNQDYIRTARAKGLPRWRVTLVHALKNSLIPVVTVVGPMIAWVLQGSFIVETIFNVPGLGKFFFTSISGRDYPVIMGTVLLEATFLVVANTLVDVVYIWLDPRIRYD